MKTQCTGLSWLGIKTDKFEDMKHFYGELLGLPLIREEHGFAVYRAENGDTFEVFDAQVNEYPHFTTAPVAGFLVEDIDIAKDEMERAGIHFIGDIDGDPNKSRWAHFKGPDGNIYELKWHAS